LKPSFYGWMFFSVVSGSVSPYFKLQKSYTLTGKSLTTYPSPSSTKDYVVASFGSFFPARFRSILNDCSFGWPFNHLLDAYFLPTSRTLATNSYKNLLVNLFCQSECNNYKTAYRFSLSPGKEYDCNLSIYYNYD
jgi:hypothetical protein